MLTSLWQNQLGAGVIDCDFDPVNRLVFAGDVTGYVLCLSYNNTTVWEQNYPMPVWGSSIFTKADGETIFAVALASKTPEAGQLVVESRTSKILQKSYQQPAWDTVFTDSARLITVTTWDGKLITYDVFSQKVVREEQYPAPLFGIAQKEGVLYSVASGLGLIEVPFKGESKVFRSPKVCYNVCVANEVILTGSTDSNIYLLDNHLNKMSAVNRYGANICSVATFQGLCLTGDFDGNLLFSPLANPTLTVHSTKFADCIWNISVDEINNLLFIACGDGNLYCYQLDPSKAMELASNTTTKSYYMREAVAVKRNSKVFISHAHEDNTRCTPLLEAFDAWGVDYWFDTVRMDAGDDLSTRIQSAVQERDIFLRICTLASQRSYWVRLETAAFRGLQARDHHDGYPDKRILVNLILEKGYQPEPFDYATIFIDATNKPQHVWLEELRHALRQL